MADIVAQTLTQEIIVAESADQDITVEVLVPPALEVVEVLVPGQVGYSSERIDVGARGILQAQPGTHKYYIQGGGTWEFDSMVISVGTAPLGDDIVLDVNLNGTSIYTDQSKRPRILAGEYFAEANDPDIFVFQSGDYFTFDMDRVGIAVPGEDLVATLRLRKVA